VVTINKYFPIQTDTACQLKWTWSTIMLYNGTTNSCHRVDTSTLSVDNFFNFHNTEKKLADRELMLDGKWPSGGCEYCGNVERAGGNSDRQFHLQIPNLSPPELDNNPRAIQVTPRIVEVYFDNVCNMSCIYCWDGFSSRIQQENIQFGNFKQGDVEIKNRATKHEHFEELSEKFWEWMEENYNQIRRLHILGGEPFFQTQFDTCLDFLETHSNPDLEFNIVSNLKVSTARFKRSIERIKKMVATKRIKRFDLTCSIDCWGKEQEYIRHGINLSEWQVNFDYIAKEKWITLNINQTITGLGVKTIKDLLQYVNKYRTERDIGHYFMACVNQPHLYPGIFGANFFDDDFAEIYKAMPTDTWQQKQALKMMQGLQLEFNTKSRNYNELTNLQIFLTELDRRRNTNWRTTFPWLEREINNVV
jgi:organic radical activating enzyme